jgi:DNA repair photolyase
VSAFRRGVCEHVFVRWDDLRVDREAKRQLPGFKEPAVVRTFDAPEALDTGFYEVRAKSAINEVPKRSRMPFRFTINPYRGCTHSCVWCYARTTHTYLDFNAGRDFEREIVVKVNAPELVRAELSKPSWQGDHVALGTNTDPYQWVESRYELMIGIWEAMRDASNPCSVLTKSPLLLRDLALMKQIAERTDFVASLSVPTLDERAWRETEPRTPHPGKRLEALAELSRAGITTGILIAPLQPRINDSPKQVEEILELATEAGVSSVAGVALHLRGEVRGIFFDWLRQHRPDLIPLYEELYRRGAYMPRTEQDRLSALVRGPKGPRRGIRSRPKPQRDDRKQREPAQPSLF